MQITSERDQADRQLREPQGRRAIEERRTRTPRPKAGSSEKSKPGSFDLGSSENRLAGTLDLCSNLSQSNLTPDFLRKLAVLRQRSAGLNKPVSYRPPELSKLLGEAKVAELVYRTRAGKSARSLALELGVANSALTRMLRAHGVTIRRQWVSEATARLLAQKYEAGATMVNSR